MAKVDLYNMAGSRVGEIELSDKVFGAQIKEHLVHMICRQLLADGRQGTQSAKTRAEVSGGGRKPWRQKGTGHARQGSTRAPQWTGGGVVFAPKPRSYSFKMNRKEKRAAMCSALTSRLEEERLIVLDELKMDTIKTKEFKRVLDAFNLDRALVVMSDGDNRNVVLSARNLPNVKTATPGSINVYDILKYQTLVLTKDAAAVIEEVYA